MTPRKLRAEERGAFLSLMGIAFGPLDHFRRYLDHDPNLGPDDTWVIVKQRKVVSAVQVFTRSICLAGETVLMGGIGSVATAPEYEGQGFASGLLSHALLDMKKRTMPLALLFARHPDFYSQFGWNTIPQPEWQFPAVPSFESENVRSFEVSDLPAVKRIYADYGKGRTGMTRRDDRYWDGQLKFAGNPEERFLVVERDSRVVAYVRSIEEGETLRVIEYAREQGAASELATAVLCSSAPCQNALRVPAVLDHELEAALRQFQIELEPSAAEDMMWHVLDRPALERLASAPAVTSDEGLLEILLSKATSIFWPSDRF